jgi:hypothetical protein
VNMKLQAEIEVVENLYKQAKLLRTAQRNDPHKTKAAAEWEIKLHEELDRLKAEVAELPGLVAHANAA